MNFSWRDRLSKPDAARGCLVSVCDDIVGHSVDSLTTVCSVGRLLASRDSRAQTIPTPTNGLSSWACSRTSDTMSGLPLANESFTTTSRA